MLRMAGEFSGGSRLKYEGGTGGISANITVLAYQNQRRICFEACWLYLVTSGIALMKHRRPRSVQGLGQWGAVEAVLTNFCESKTLFLSFRS